MGRVIRDTPNTGKLPELGKIKIGDKALSKSGKEYPISLDFFRATGKYAPMFYEQFGEKCDTIPVIFPSDNIDAVCNEEYVIRDRAGKLVATGDGKNWKVYEAKTESYEFKEMDIVLAEKLGIMKLTLTLRFLIPKVPAVGVWRFETMAKASSIPQLRDTFDYVQQQAGSIVGIPFDLSVKKVKSQKPGVASQYPVVSLVPNLSPQHIEMLNEYLQSGNKVKGILSAQKIDAMLSLPPAQIIVIEESPEEVKSEYVEYEDIESELDIAIREIMACESYTEAAVHWKNHKHLWEETAYLEAKEQVKEKFTK
jgi:hypothetical protein